MKYPIYIQESEWLCTMLHDEFKSTRIQNYSGQQSFGIERNNNKFIVESSLEALDEGGKIITEKEFLTTYKEVLNKINEKIFNEE